MDKGALIRQVRHKGAPMWAVIPIGILVFMMTMAAPEVLLSEKQLFLKCFYFAFLAFLYFLLYINLNIDKEKIRLSLYEKGFESDSFKWTGNSFISWGDIQSIHKWEYYVRGNTLEYLYFVPDNPNAYWKKRSIFMRLIGIVERYKHNTPIFLMTQYADIPSDELMAECQSALENYRTKHGIQSSGAA